MMSLPALMFNKSIVKMATAFFVFTKPENTDLDESLCLSLLGYRTTPLDWLFKKLNAHDSQRHLPKYSKRF